MGFVPRSAGDSSCVLMFFTSLFCGQLYPSVNANNKACLPTVLRVEHSKSFHKILDFQNTVKLS